MVILETPIFTKRLLTTLSDDEYRLLQQYLVQRPGAGKVIPGSSGIRKLRWAKEGQGKRGGVRLIYYWFVTRETILLLFIYPKSIREDLTPDQIKKLRKIIDEEYHEK